jgi:uncharacterized membrane protein YeiB
MPDNLTTATGQTLAPPAGRPAKARVFGVDVTRGIALIGMLAANTFDVLNDAGKPTLAVMTVIGRSATLFVMVAGISLAFLSGGRHPVRGNARRTAAAGIATRAMLIGILGLALGHAAEDLAVILAYYGLLFLLAIPLLGLRPRALAGIAGALTVVGPLVLLTSFRIGLEPAFDSNPTLTAPFTDPIGFILQILITGAYPVIVYLAYICAGLAIGRLDLSSAKVAAWLLGGGLALAVTAWVTSSALLFRLGGLRSLQEAAGDETSPANVTDKILWDPDQVESWWWLALRGHHSGTPIDMLHTLGSAMAILGAALLVTKLPAARRLLRPVGVAGSMTLTIYSVHALVLNLDLVDDDRVFYLVQIAVAVAFAALWHRFRGQGPLERLVAEAAGRVRRAVAARNEAPVARLGVSADSAPAPPVAPSPHVPRTVPDSGRPSTSPAPE